MVRMFTVPDSVLDPGSVVDGGAWSLLAAVFASRPTDTLAGLVAQPLAIDCSKQKTKLRFVNVLMPHFLRITLRRRIDNKTKIANG